MFYEESSGLYHLFYQWKTPRRWGHAISSNLVDWDILPVALNYTQSPFTHVPGKTPGVYSGSTTLTNGGPWITLSVPTNDMVLLARPAGEDPTKLEQWEYPGNNPIIKSTPPWTSWPPPGRDPTEAWPCADGLYCMAYATQASEGCPCSGSSSIVVAQGELSMRSQPWEVREDALLTDIAGAVMYECPDFFPVFGQSSTTSVWALKLSIGSGPSYELPWGNPSPRDYWLTGTFNSSSVSAAAGFLPDAIQVAQLMNRSGAVVIDAGAFYASKTFRVGDRRILFGWLPEERPTTDCAQPWGWAGVQSLPREVIAYRDDNAGWRLRAPPLESAMEVLRGDSRPVLYPLVSIEGTSGKSTQRPPPRTKQKNTKLRQCSKNPQSFQTASWKLQKSPNKPSQSINNNSKKSRKQTRSISQQVFPIFPEQLFGAACFCQALLRFI